SLLAKAVLEIVDRRCVGMFHIVGERMSRYEFAIKVAEVLNLDKSLIYPCKISEMKWYAKRPIDSSLKFEQTKNTLKTDFYSTSKALKMLREEVEAI
ncbi:MAG: sugar nucleotide-binding protein, partial [Aquificaceae bacterium]|nr:sugar nucleotide-binding protein [Aquificaceae bacterium]